MITVEQIEAIGRACFGEGLSIRQIARRLHHGRLTVLVKRLRPLKTYVPDPPHALV